MKLRLVSLPLVIALVIASTTSVLEPVGASQGALSAIAVKKDSSPLRGNRSAVAERYQIKPDQSHFMVEAYSGGLLWFLGHTHHFAIRNFTGEAQAVPATLEPASLHLMVKADSLEETGKNFTEEQKRIINDGARKEVLEAASYPEIVFTSTDLKSKKVSDHDFKAEIGGNLSLHGVTRRIVIPAQVVLNGDTLHASGEFSINRSDYGVKTHSIKGGMIRVRDNVKFTFDILATKF